MRGKLSAVLVTAALALGSSQAGATDVTAECASVYVQAQIFQKDAKYSAAAKAALACAKPTCGEAISGECGKLYDVAQSVTPSLIFAARDADNNELLNVRVFVDGVLVQEKLDGTAVTLDPGVHTFRYEAPGLPPVQKQYAVRTGEKLRILSEVLGEKHVAPKVKEPPVAPPPPPPPPSVSPTTLRIAGGVVLGVGAIAFTSFGLFRLSAMNDYDTLVNGCSPMCGQEPIDSVRQKLILSTVSLGVGVAAAVTSVTLFAASGAKKSSPTARIVPRGSGAEAQFVVHF